MIDILFGELSFWHWLILGVALIVLEILAPGLVFLWLGVAALVVGLITALVAGLLWQQQLLLFAGIAMIAVILGRKALARQAEPTDHPTLNQKGRQYVGQVFPLHAPIVNGLGRVKIGDTLWRVAGPELPQGTAVRVIAADSLILTVEPVDG